MQILDKFYWNNPKTTLWTEIVQIKPDIFYSFN